MGLGQGIKFQVAECDALALELDVLVVKHAQASFGVDAEVKRRLGLDIEMALRPGGHRIIGGRPELAAAEVVVLGVPPLQDFGYPEITHFARRAMALVKAELPAARRVGMTLHGAGFGLDEVACFDALFAGLLDAVADGAASPALEEVVIAESERGRARRLHERLLEVLPGGVTFVGGRPGEEVAARLRVASAGVEEERDHAFVAMPFALDFEDVFHYGIAKPIRRCGLLCERIDQVAFTGEVLGRIKERIRTATLVVADLTDANPNVYLEVGFAWGAGVPTVLLRRSGSDLKFDVQGERCLGYASIKDLEERLTKELEQLIHD